MTYAPYALTERLEAELGDPNDDAQEFSLARCLDLDAREEFPTRICAQLDRLSIPAYYVPARHGGAVHSFEDTLQVVRLMARRDLTVAIAHGKTFLGGISAWVAADPDQAKQLAAEIISGRVVSWGLTEREHGGDLLAGQVSARENPDGYRIDGEKWLINNATRADLICVLARTEPAGGARGFSLLLVDKQRLAPGRYQHRPRVRLHGIRGADISGIDFDGAQVTADALVGARGAGLEITLKGFQLTRTLCAGLSLGAADRALRLALRFAREHRMYNRTLIELPHAARTLVEAYTDLLIAEVTSTVATRSIHALPGELSIASAVVKYLVPTGTDRSIAALGQVLGARAFLAGTYQHGAYQKLERDHRIVGIFDGSTLVNLNSVINQFPFLARGYRRGQVDEAGLAVTADLDRPPPEFDPARLDLVARNGSSLVAALPAAVAEIRRRAADGEIPPRLAARAGELEVIAADLHEQMSRHRPVARQLAAESFTLAEQYSLLFAAAACLQFWLHNRSKSGLDEDLWDDGRWIEGCLARLLQQLRPGPDDDLLDQLLPALVAQHESGRLFSPLPCRLAEAPR